MMQPSQVIKTIQQRNADKDRVRDQVASVHSVNGLFAANGAGEATAQLLFPVKFIERPLITFGAELDPTVVVTPGQFPTCSTVVGSWIISGPMTKRLWVGCTVLIKTTGPATQKLWVHWSATARATTNPAT